MSGWCYDNSLDIVLAHVVEVAEADDRVDESQIERWRVAASVPDLHFAWPVEGDVEAATMIDLLGQAEQRIRSKGDVTKADLVGWSVLDGLDVSSGYLRHDVLEAEVIATVASTFAELIADTHPKDEMTDLWLGFPEPPHN